MTINIKEAEALSLLRKHEPLEGYYVAYSLRRMGLVDGSTNKKSTIGDPVIKWIN